MPGTLCNVLLQRFPAELVMTGASYHEIREVLEHIHCHGSTCFGAQAANHGIAPANAIPHSI